MKTEERGGKKTETRALQKEKVREEESAKRTEKEPTSVLNHTLGKLLKFTK